MTAKHTRQVGGSSPLIAAARRHFFAHGFRTVTMDDLAHELGMSKKTLYAEFDSKTALLKAVLDAKFSEINCDLDAATNGHRRDFLTRLEQLLTEIERHSNEIQPAFIRDIRIEAPELFTLIESRRREIIERCFGKILRQGRRDGRIRQDISNRLIIEILLGTTQAIVNPVKLHELGWTPRKALAAILEVFFQGVIVRGRGRKK